MNEINVQELKHFTMLLIEEQSLTNPRIFHTNNIAKRNYNLKVTTSNIIPLKRTNDIKAFGINEVL